MGLPVKFIEAPRGGLHSQTVTVMGSKYVANRLIILGLLSHGESVFRGMPDNADITYALAGAKALGGKGAGREATGEEAISREIVDREVVEAKAEQGEVGEVIRLHGLGGTVDLDSTTTMNMDAAANSHTDVGTHASSLQMREVYTGDNGTFSRLIAPVAALINAGVRLTASEQMTVRPMRPLYDALRELGVTVTCEHKTNSFPVTLKGPPRLPASGMLKVSGELSSQFISALLIAAPYYSLAGVEGKISAFSLCVGANFVSRAYVDLTIDLMKKFGVEVFTTQDKETGESLFTVPIPQTYRPQSLHVEGDVVAASYFWALALLAGEELSVTNYPHHSQMGEAGFITVLEKMGAMFRWAKTGDQGLTILPMSASDSTPTPTSSTLGGTGLRGHKNLSMRDMPDVLPTLAVLAAFGAEPVRMENIAHLRYKESNRVETLAEELESIGIHVTVEEDALTVHPLGEAECRSFREKELRLSAHGDHRLAMAFSLLALKSKRVILVEAESVNKSFPKYFSLLQTLGFAISDKNLSERFS